MPYAFADACKRLARLKDALPSKHECPLMKAMQLHFFAEQIRQFTYNTLKGKAQ
jgi:hypothetical protein